MIVDAFNALLRAGVSAYSGLFAAWSPFIGLLLLSAVFGVGMLWVVGKTSDQRAIGLAKKRMQAYLLEMRIYSDEPRVLLRAQWMLLAQNAKYVGHMLRPALFLALPMVVLYAHLDAVYGKRPLHVGESALVEASTDVPAPPLGLTAAGGVTVDSTSVTASGEGRTFWRIRAVRAESGELRLTTPGGTVSKSVATGSGHAYVSASRARAWWRRLLLEPGEPRLDAADVSRLALAYPSREVGPPGWETHWAVWFLGVSIMSAFVLKGRFGIVL